MPPFMYIGAELKKHGVMPHQLFTAQPTDLIARLKPQFPLIEQLFIPMDELSCALQEVRIVGSLRRKAYIQTMF